MRKLRVAVLGQEVFSVELGLQDPECLTDEPEDSPQQFGWGSGCTIERSPETDWNDNRSMRGFGFCS